MDGTLDGGRWLSYAQLAELRGITKKAAIRMTQRHRWRRQPGNDGTALVSVPESDLTPRQPSPQTPRRAGGSRRGRRRSRQIPPDRGAYGAPGTAGGAAESDGNIVVRHSSTVRESWREGVFASCIPSSMPSGMLALPFKTPAYADAPADRNHVGTRGAGGLASPQVRRPVRTVVDDRRHRRGCARRDRRGVADFPRDGSTSPVDPKV
jgi:hypothetical protein